MCDPIEIDHGRRIMPSQCLSKDIKITPAKGRVDVHFDGRVIASSTRALDLDEPGAPLRIYIPREDVEAGVLADSATHTTCPYKGVASYHSLKSGAAEARDAVWYYPEPCPLVAPIRDHLAFWGDKIRYDVQPA
jgi:uncharacterized protein (DUF427 family)